MNRVDLYIVLLLSDQHTKIKSLIIHIKKAKSVQTSKTPPMPALASARSILQPSHFFRPLLISLTLSILAIASSSWAFFKALFIKGKVVVVVKLVEKLAETLFPGFGAPRFRTGGGDGRVFGKGADAGVDDVGE